METVLTVLGWVVAVWGMYLALLAVVRPRAVPVKENVPLLRMVVLIPAHNEERGIARTVRSIVSQEYPPHLRSVLVVADNCTDDTAEQARAAGAEVLVRTHATERGKGFAVRAGISAALERMGPGELDALVVMDADSMASPLMLDAFDRALSQGAEVVQGYHAVLNPEHGDYARLMSLAYALFHPVRSRARHALGLSAGLRGNGMCFSRHALEHLPLTTTGLVEDVEQGILLGLAGVRVHFAQEAVVFAEMPVTRTQARTQRLRWEQGRFELVRRHVPQLIRQAWIQRSFLCADLAMDLLVPSLATAVIAAATGLGLSVAAVVSGGWPVSALIPWVVACVGLGIHIVGGLVTSPRGWSALWDLRLAPAYMLWKLGVRLRALVTRGSGVWVRTARQGEA